MVARLHDDREIIELLLAHGAHEKPTPDKANDSTTS
jgi:hypothetical protein